ncbi:MAG TPA: NAD(P)/FAD-dependent oxidoreductase [Bryobacteraceae bacterium]|jgi:monoamine oxidase|nr:NAD(P)/FAD-dependent oxidoreductase [Bryobacteraceae bacterium]
MREWDLAVAGAGAAGLAAAARLAQAGLQVLCIEARDRVGGRIRTVRDPLAPLPVELGAEFIHGRPPEIWQIAQASSLNVYDCAESSKRIRHGVLQKKRDAWNSIERVMQDMQRAAKRRDESFATFLEKSTYSSDVKNLAANYVEGFNAARKEIVGIRSLAADAQASDAIDADRSFRIASGYDSIPLYLLRAAPPEHFELRLSTILQEVNWRAGRVELRCVHALTGEAMTFAAKKAVFTLPLGVLQSDAIRWSPAVKRMPEAARALAFGQVVRVVLRFREPFWEQKEEFADAGFLLSDEYLFPTWWTARAVHAPILTGWSAGPHADDLLGKSRDQVIAAAVASLAKILGVKLREITDQLARAYFHDWHADPFAGGAYSYVPANASKAREELAAPIENTLFFAGEATELDGHSATVHGAIRSGFRAVKQIRDGH